MEGGGRYFSEDFGQTWSDPVSRPPTPGTDHWHQWDPYLVERDPQTDEVTRIWETGYDTELGHKRPRSYLRSSRDAGQTWSDPIQVLAWKNANDIALVKWQYNDKGLNDQTTISDAPFDSDLRNVFDPNPP